MSGRFFKMGRLRYLKKDNELILQEKIECFIEDKDGGSHWTKWTDVPVVEEKDDKDEQDTKK